MRFSTLALMAGSALALPAAEKRVTLDGVLPTIVFTPGAWHGTWAFDMVRGNLSLLGFPTEAVALPSVGSTDASVGLADDAAALKTKLTELADAGKDIVMVTHSYGGTVGSTAVEGLGYKTRKAAGKTGGVISLVYMTAFAAPANSSLLDALGGVYLPWMEAVGDFVVPETPQEVFYADLPEYLAEQAIASLKQEPARIVSDDVPYAPWTDGVNCAFFFTLLDQAIPIATQRTMQAQFPSGSFTYTFNSSHSPFLSMPQNVATAVELAAADALVKKLL